MQRFHAPVVDGWARFSRAQLHQIRHVLRLADGQQVAVFDGLGGEWLAALHGDRGELVKPIDQSVEPRTRLTLYQALIRPANFELILQKGAELGVAHFVPFTSERTVVSGERRTRWRTILIEAAEQSGRRIVPEVGSLLTFDQAVAEATKHGVPFMPWEGADRPRLASVHRPSPELALIVGPEGGFSEAEVERARMRGVVTVTLGRRILRAETAAIVAAGLLLQLNGDI
ncbi:MAG TPA: RsmE family RNA methyltransferase [Chloroflexota bacterium]|nr:RsmE family RNA methyltransferase [Chloroflexota bacterium]